MQNNMVIIGVVAAPAGGKSTVARYLADLGATWINADQIAHQVLQLPHVAAQIIDHFGTDIADANGQINRSLLGAKVFGDDAQSVLGLRYLESVVHPETRQRILEELIQADRVHAPGVVLDVPLLIESGWANQCDEVWYIDTPASIQAQEADRRGWSPEKLRKRQTRQLPLEEKRRLATKLIPNDGTLTDLRMYVEKIWRDCVQASAVDAHQSTSENHCHPSSTRDH
jgi:dephospho-CoA kinase